MPQALDDLADRRGGIGPGRAGFAGRNRGALRSRGGLLDERVRALLELGDHAVDLLTRLPQPVVELLVHAFGQPALAFRDGALALAQRLVLLDQAGAFAFELAALGVERAGLRIDPFEMRIEALAVVAEIAARGRDDRRGQAQALRDLNRQAAPGRAVDEPIAAPQVARVCKRVCCR